MPFGPGGQSSRAIPHGHRLELRDDSGERVAVEFKYPTRMSKGLWSSLKASCGASVARVARVGYFLGVKKRVFQADFQPPRKHSSPQNAR